MGVKVTNNEMKLNEGFVKRSISLKSINGGLNKVQGVGKKWKINKRGVDVYLAP